MFFNLSILFVVLQWISVILMMMFSGRNEERLFQKFSIVFGVLSLISLGGHFWL